MGSESGWCKITTATATPLTHIFPTRPVANHAHVAEPNRVYEPQAECWLCQLGICVQSLVADGIVEHGTWAGH